MSGLLNPEAIRTVYAKSANAKALLDHFAERQKNASETAVDTVLSTLNRGGLEATRNEIVSILRDLEEAGAGQFIVGRKGHPSRFVWQGSSTEIGNIARNSAPTRTGQQEPLAKPSVEEVSAFVKHPFLLRPGTSIYLELPGDLTVVEARRVADFVLSLPFER